MRNRRYAPRRATTGSASALSLLRSMRLPGSAARSTMVHRDRHPLNRRCRPGTGLGRDRYYSKNDRVTILVHSIFDMRTRSSIMLGLRPSLDLSIGPTVPRAKSVFAGPGAPTEVLCRGCLTRDPGKMELSADRDALVCRDCGTICAAEFTSERRDKQCDISEDNTLRADAARREATDLSAPTPSAAEARRLRERAVQATFVSKRAAEASGIGFSHANAVRKAAQQENKDPRRWNAHSALMDGVFTAIDLKDGRIKAHCKLCLRTVMLNGEKHGRLCCHEATRCLHSLDNMTGKALVEATMSCALQMLVQRHKVLDGVTHSATRGVNAAFEKRPRSVRGSTYANNSRVNALLQMPESELCESCDPAQAQLPVRTPQRGALACGGVALQRQASAQDLPQDNEFLSMRNTLHSLYKELVIPQVDVIFIAIAAVGNSDLRSNLFEEGRRRNLGEPEMAIAVLLAVCRCRGELTPSLEKRALDRAGGSAAMEEFSGRVQSMLPQSALASPGAADDDMFMGEEALV